MTFSRRLLPFAGLLATLALTAPAAQAAGVQVGQGDDGREIFFGALPGERNDVDVSVEATGAVRIADRVPITSGPGCTPSGVLVVRCPVAGGVAGVTIGVRDGDDTVLVSGVGAKLFGGPGNDTMHGGNRPSRFDGGPGDDVLTGGTAGDFFDEGTQANGADRLIGNTGNGSDEVSYAKRSRRVVADLIGDRDDGEAGEGDQIASDIEELTGGKAGDRLSGNRADNIIQGRGGSDVIKGRAGDDRLSAGADLLGREAAHTQDRINGGPGIDTVSGSAGDNRLTGGPNPDVILAGRGDDRIGERDKRIDQVVCGPGDDRASLDGYDFFAGGCERVARSFRPAAVPLQVDTTANRGGTAFVEIGCPEDGPDRCSGRARILLGGVSLGSDPFGVDNGAKHDAVIELPDNRIATLRKGTKVKVRVRSRDTLGHIRTVTAQLDLPPF